MIRVLNISDKDSLMKYTKEEEQFNLYIIGYVSNYGFNKDFLNLWGEFDNNHQLKGILMKYYNDFIFYAKGDFDVKGFSEIINNSKVQVLAGKKNVVENFEKYCSISSKTDTHFCVQENCRNSSDMNLLGRVKRMIPHNLQGIIELYDKIDEFENNETDNTALRQRIGDGCGRGYYIEEKGEVAAAVQTTAEYNNAAMIVSVSTSPEHRKKGFVSACLSKLCLELSKENKKLYLYYYNLEAGKIYNKLGFKEIGLWTRYAIK